MKILRFFVVIGLFSTFLLSIGCTHQMVAKQYPVDSELLPEFSSSTPVTLINAQESSDEVLVGKNMGHKFFGNLQQYTDTVIATIETELSKKDIPTVENAKKKLEIMVIDVEIQPGMWGFGCDAHVSVKTGDGFNKVFLGQGGSGIIYTVVNGALNEAVVAILKDENIINYLER